MSILSLGEVCLCNGLFSHCLTLILESTSLYLIINPTSTLHSVCLIEFFSYGAHMDQGPKERPNKDSSNIFACLHLVEIGSVLSLSCYQSLPQISSCVHLLGKGGLLKKHLIQTFGKVATQGTLDTSLNKQISKRVLSVPPSLKSLLCSLCSLSFLSFLFIVFVYLCAWVCGWVHTCDSMHVEIRGQ